jgi:hypothetical protein
MILRKDPPPERPGRPPDDYVTTTRVRRTANGPASTRPTPGWRCGGKPNGLPVASF